MAERPDAAHVEALISGLGAAGVRGAAQEFSLDRDKARDKMRQFQLADPHRYVLELVQAAVLKGATRLEFEIDADDMRLTFDGRPFSREDFEALYSSLFARMRNPENDARQHLAVGLNAAMGLNPRWIRVGSGGTADGAEAGLRLELRPGQADRITARQGGDAGAGYGSAGAVADTVIHVKARFRPGLVVGFVRNLQRTIPEEKLLRTHCARGRVDISLDGAAINRGYELPGAVAAQDLPGDGVWGCVGFDPARGEGATIDWIKHGVWITTHEFHPDRDRAWVDVLGLDAYPGLVAVVEADALRMDFSRQDIVWDDAYREVLGHLVAARGLAVKQICRSLDPKDGYIQDSLRDWARELVRRVTGKLTPEEARTTDETQVGYHVARVPVWQTLTGSRVSLHRILQEAEAQGTVGFTFLGFGATPDDLELNPEALSAGRLVLHLRDDAEETLWRRHLGERLRLVTRELQARVEAVQSRRRFQKRRARVALPDGETYLATASLQAPGLHGIIGLRADWTESRLTLVRDGCLLAQIETIEPLPGLELVLEGGFTPDETFTDAVRDDTYALAVAMALATLEGLYTSAAGDQTSRIAARLHHALQYLHASLTPDFAARFMQRWGADGALADPERARPALGVGQVPGRPDNAEAHPLAQVPLIPDVTGRRWSLAELADALARDGALGWVPATLPEVSDYPRRLLRLGPEEQGVLEAIFGARLRCDQPSYQAELGAAAHRRKPQLPLEAPAAGTGDVRARFECGTAQGSLAFRHVGSAPCQAPCRLQALLERRSVQTWDVELPVPALMAVINDDRFRPSDDWSALASEQDLARAQRIVHAAAVQVLGHVAIHFDAVDDSQRQAARRLLRLALTCLLPRPIFGEALRRLRERDPEPWERYMELVALAAWLPLGAVVTALRAVCSAGQPPTAERVWAQIAPGQPLPEPLPPVRVDVAPCGEIFATPPTRTTPGADAGGVLIQHLVTLPLFDTAAGQGIDLETLRGHAAAGPVPYLMERSDAALLADRLVVNGSQQDRDDLIRLLGGEALVDATPLLAGRRKAAEFESRGEAALRLLDEVSLFKTACTAAGTTGEVGLAAEPADGNWVLLHRNRRYVCRLEGVFTQHLVAVLNHDGLTLTPDFHDVVRDAAFAEVLTACEDRLPRLLEALAEQWPRLTGARREIAYDHVLAFLAGPQAEAWRRSGRPPTPLQQTLGALPGFQGATGQPYSLDDLRAEHDAQGELVYLPGPAPGATSRRVPILAGRRLGLVHRLFDGVRDFSDEWELLCARWVFNLQGAPPMPRPDPEAELVGVRVHGAGFEGRLYLPLAADAPLVLRFGVAGLEVLTEPLSELLPYTGLLEISPTAYRQSGGRIPLSAHDRDNLQTAAYRLYRGLAQGLARLEPPARQARAQELLRAALLAIGARLRDRFATAKDRLLRLHDLLARLPLLPLPDGRLLSQHAALELRPPELAHLGLWEAPRLARPVAPASPADAELPAPAPAPYVAPPATAPPAAAPPGPDADPGDALLPAVFAAAPTTPEAEPPADPAARLARLLDGALGRFGDQSGIGHQEVRRHLQRGLRLAEGAPDAAAGCDEQGLSLRRGHVLVEAVLAHGDEDPLLVSLLLSAVYTAVNLYLEQVTDDHEHAFLDALAAGVAEDLEGADQRADLPSGPAGAT